MSRELEREIQTLREQLAEAEEMRRAIMRAEIDGFVVGEKDSDRYVHLLAGAYERDTNARRRRLAASDETTRRFLSLLSIELLAMLKAVRVSLEVLRNQSLGEEGADAVESIERQTQTLQRLAEDLRNVNPRE